MANFLIKVRSFTRDSMFMVNRCNCVALIQNLKSKVCSHATSFSHLTSFDQWLLVRHFMLCGMIDAKN